MSVLREHLIALPVIGGTDAGDPMYGFYPQADALFPILANEFILLQDTQAGTFGLAWFMGLDPYERPRFAVRDDVVLNSKIAYHECGHAFEATVIERAMKKWGKTRVEADDWIKTRYWLYRGFPGTWQEAHNFANSASGGWFYYPAESLAEAFSAAVSGYVQNEWTNTYGKDLAVVNGQYDPYLGAMNARKFFLAIMQEVSDEMTPEQDAMLRRVLSLLEAREALVWTARLQRGLNVETGKPYDGSAPIDPRIKQ